MLIGRFQILSYDSTYPAKTIDRYLEKILLLLSGSCQYTHGQSKTVVSCVEGLNWLQVNKLFVFLLKKVLGSVLHVQLLVSA